MQQSAHAGAVLLQVAKALLDSVAKAPPKPRAPSMQGASLADPSTLTALLRFQEASGPHCQSPKYDTLSRKMTEHCTFLLLCQGSPHISPAVYIED